MTTSDWEKAWEELVRQLQADGFPMIDIDKIELMERGKAFIKKVEDSARKEERDLVGDMVRMLDVDDDNEDYREGYYDARTDIIKALGKREGLSLPAADQDAGLDFIPVPENADTNVLSPPRSTEEA